MQICTGSSLPTSRVRTSIWSESGCFSRVRIFPTFTFFMLSLRSSVTSTLDPEIVIASAKSLSLYSSRLKSTNSFSHFLDNFI
ncbi:hypothetical protein EVA_17271 [gut metagenome]|uniref:Uncharacterized protein n=1 Tax=gut metagenome TaxID=749906 RepID=J9FYK6_9ZZZZ